MSGLTQRQMDQRVERRVKRLLNKQMRELSDMTVRHYKEVCELLLELGKEMDDGHVREA